MNGLCRKKQREAREKEKGLAFPHGGSGDNQASVSVQPNMHSLYQANKSTTKDNPQEVEQKPVVLNPVSPVMKEVVRLARNSGKEVLMERYQIKIRIRDLKTLEPEKWLNEEIINFYLNMIVERSHNQQLPTVYAFGTQFYIKLAEGGHGYVKRWTKKVDLFEKRLILVPIHLEDHWVLVSIDTEQKTENYHNSMGDEKKHGKLCLARIVDYIKEEHSNKKGVAIDTSIWKKTISEDIPQQDNAYDCGLFILKYAECVSRLERMEFSQDDMDLYRERMTYKILENIILSP